MMNQFQQDVTNLANGMVTQMLCMEKGIDYNQLMLLAQQQHINNIMAMEQQRQINNVIKRHYQGGNNGIFSKLREAFSPEPAMPMFTNPMMGTPYPQPGMPTQAMPVYNPTQIANAFMEKEPALPIQEEEDRVNKLEKDVSDLKQLITSLAQSLNSTQ